MIVWLLSELIVLIDLLDHVLSVKREVKKNH